MRITSVVGARPQFVKLAAIVRELERRRGLGVASPEHTIVHTGQHYDYEMSSAFFDQLGLPAPDFHLGVGSGSHGLQTGRMVEQIERVLLQGRHDGVLVYGDTNSTLAGALAAAKLHIPVAHVEAGLRSHNRRMPEELNRVLADHASDILLCPSKISVDNLRREGFLNFLDGCCLMSEDSSLDRTKDAAARRPIVVNVGDVMYDLLLMSLEIVERRASIVERLSLQPGGYFLATVHRAENTDDPDRLRQIFDALDELAARAPLAVPLHPRTRKALTQAGVASRRLRLIDPAGYFDMLALEKHARLILTDSGGVQKEAYWLGVPCVTLREETEWPETIEAGANALAGVDGEGILKAASQMEARFGELRPSGSMAYGDGRAAKRIVRVLLNE
ncbi:MAG: UDP-N-acetyl glucosamine 2-epimerase [Chloroflexi bacterium]|nr:UDP-N-acetyl glucosamine 2-epimerase [Chloroflexota bacterium]